MGPLGEASRPHSEPPSFVVVDRVEATISSSRVN
jgi:hypothetical protein